MPVKKQEFILFRPIQNHISFLIFKIRLIVFSGRSVFPAQFQRVWRVPRPQM